jgi:uncharacterized protein (TIGR03083 family)
MAQTSGRAAYVAAIAEGRDRIVERARAAGPDAPVPMSSRWTVRDLVIHVGNVHDWAAAVLRSGIEQPQVFDAEPAGIAASFDELLFWYAARAGALLDLLLSDDVPDDRPVWTFGPPGTAAFWPRRQAHEVTMHAVDATTAAGQELADALMPLDPVLCADGVDEIFSVMMPRVAFFVPRPALPARLAVEAIDTGDRWELESDGQFDSAATGSPVGASLVGPASGLFALLWRRGFLAADGAEIGVGVEGDRAVVDALFAARLTP